MDTFKDFLQIVTYVVAIFAAGASWWQYRRNSARERTRWLFELYQRLYEHPALKDMRVRIDWGDTAFVQEEKDASLFGDLDNFLNFFEFLAYLRKQKELHLREIQAMFAYALSTISKDKAVLAYLRKYGYEELDALLKEMRYAA
ncbi:MAG: hypothetical protein ACRD5W_00045 [Candidatus Acidiferrales bacterium]